MKSKMEHNKPLGRLPTWKAHHCKGCEYKHWRSSILVPLGGSRLPTSGLEYKKLLIHESARLCGWHEIVQLERIQEFY